MAAKQKRSAVWLLFVLLTGALLALVSLREQALTALGQALVRSDVPEKADLIYVLAGDFWGSRVLVGADLGARGYAKRVVLSGGQYQDKNSGDMAVDFAVQHGYTRCLFYSVHLNGPSTIDEAREIGPVFQRLGARRIILVTSNFHSRRAGLVFRLVLPAYNFQVVAAPETDFDPASWWKNEHARRLCFSEYQKIAGTLLLSAGSL